MCVVPGWLAPFPRSSSDCCKICQEEQYTSSECSCQTGKFTRATLHLSVAKGSRSVPFAGPGILLPSCTAEINRSIPLCRNRQ
jgi:hypothetical protein